MDQVDLLVRNSPAKYVAAIFDSCFSGSIFQTRGVNTNVVENGFSGLREKMRHPIRFYISAGGSTQRVPEPSPMPALLVRALRGEADLFADGVISATELGLFLSEQAPRLSGAMITPRYGPTLSGPLSMGEFYFARGLSPIASPRTFEEPVRGGEEMNFQTK
jgi:hypothetical protein